MDSSDTEGDSVTMEVDGGMVAMDTNDEHGFDGRGETWTGESTDMNTDTKEMQGPLPGPSVSEPLRQVGQQSSPRTSDPSVQGVCQLWRLPEGVCRKRVLQRGEGLYGPAAGSRCTVTLQVSRSTCSLDLCYLGYSVGQGDLQIGEGGTPVSCLIDQALLHMKRGETSEVCVSGLRCVSGDVALHVTLHDFTAATPPWRMTPLEKCTAAKSLKERGAQLFKDGNVYAAFAQFRSATRLLLSVLPFSFADSDSSEKAHKQLLCQCYLNLAACQMKSGHHQHVITNCTKALGIDPHNVKALYRRASANVTLGNHLLAQEDLEKGVRQEPNNRVLAELLQTVSAHLAHSQSQMAQGLGKMFS